MKNLFIAIFTLVSIASCKQKEKETEIEPMTEVDAEPIDETANEILLEEGCYAYNDDENLVRFEITQIEGSSVKGNLNYAYAEKDKNEGTFEGVLTGDKLLGKYKFMSEGTESLRDIAFKVDANRLVEGYGAMNDDGTTFKDTSSIEYSSSFPLTRGECN